MGRGGAPYLNYAATILLSTISTASAGLWDVSIDLSPAPSPQDGPTFSAHATRNRALLPYQIIGIVGAYIGTVVITTTLLFTVGRRLRKRALQMSERPTEMVKPINRAFDPSPVSPHSFMTWGSKLRNKKSTGGSVRSGESKVASPDMNSVMSFDQHLIEQNKQKAEDDLAHLYDVVFEHDDQKNQHRVTSTGMQPASPPQYSGSRGPSLTISRPDMYGLQTSDPYLYSPTTPISSSARAIYPPGNSNVKYISYEGRSSTSVPHKNGAQAQTSQTQTREVRALSFGSSHTADHNTSTSTGKLRKGVLRGSMKDIKISAPIQRFHGDHNSDGARTPLSPRYYPRPGTPPDPPNNRTSDTQYQQNSPSTTTSPAFSEMQYEYDQQLDVIRELPQPNPQRITIDTQQPRPQGAPTLSPNKRSAANVNNPLPFRQNRYVQQHQQQRNANTDSPAGGWNFSLPRSPPPDTGYLSPSMKSPAIRERVVEISNKRLGAPYTGCATPYSPYMPFTPVTPITPHLETRLERKQRQKEEKAARGAITEEDQVADEKDIWASGY